MEVCGADMNMVRISVVTGRDEFWDNLIAARKNAFKQAALIGYRYPLSCCSCAG